MVSCALRSCSSSKRMDKKELTGVTFHRWSNFSQTGFPFDAESAADEFPFNRRASRDDHLQSTLDDLAKRHPDIAGHFQNLNQRPRSRSKPAEEFKARLRRPFGSKFPFDDDDFDIDPQQYAKQFYNPQEFHKAEGGNYPQTSSYQEPPRHNESSTSYPQHQPQSTSYPQHQAQSTSYSQHQPPSETTASQPPQPETTFQPPENPPTPEKEKVGIQQSNTVDLGQKQEPIDDRNQRSMSAPPGGETNKRYTSSINIPVNTPTENMSQNTQQQQHDPRFKEVIIPIRVEGRDDPVFPKNPHIPPQAQPHHQRQGFPEDHFTRQNIPHNFQPRESQHQQYQQPQPNPQQQQNQQEYQHQPRQQQQQQQRPRQDVPIPVQRETPSAEQKRQQSPPPQNVDPQEPKPASQERKPLTPIEQIQVIQKDVSNLMEHVENFTGKSGDKQYLYLDEMLTRNLIKLDDIDTQGQENIRQSRREAIKCIQQAISQLESIASAAAAAKMEVDEKPQPTAEEVTDDKTKGASKSDSNEQNEKSGPSSEAEKMDVTENNVTESQPTEAKDFVESANSESTNQENRAVLVVDSKVQGNEDGVTQNTRENKPEVENVTSKDKKKEKKDKKAKDCIQH